MFLPYGVDVPLARLPIANWALIAFTSLISVAILLGVGRNDDPFSQDDGVPPLALRPRNLAATQFVTSLFVHADFVHLIGNMIFLFVFGNAVNAKLGHGLYVASYLAFGVVESFAWVLLGDGRPVVGASGAIMGVVGVFLVLFPRNDITVFYYLGAAFSGEFTIAAGWLILFYVGSDLLGVLFAGGGAVAYICHLAGALAGIIFAVAMVGLDFVEPTAYEENLLQTLGLREKSTGMKGKKSEKK